MRLVVVLSAIVAYSDVGREVVEVAIRGAEAFNSSPSPGGRLS